MSQPVSFHGWGLRRSALAVSVVFFASTFAHAGPIFFAGTLADGEFVADSAVKAAYTIKFSDLSATVDNDDRADVTITETVTAPAEPVRTVCLIPLPAGVGESQASVSIRGSVARPVQYFDAAQARHLYESIAKETGDVQIVSLTGQPALVLPAVTLVDRIEMTISVSVPVQERQGVLSVACPMPMTEWSVEPVSRVTLAATVGSEKPLRAVFSPSHEVTVTRPELTKATVRSKADNWQNSDDFRLCWVADENDLGLRVLTWRDSPEDGGYFMLVGNPTGGRDDKPIDKDVIFVLDTSGSMRGDKIEQCRAAIDYCLTQLNDGDRFNIVTFGSDVSMFRDNPTRRSSESTASAQTFVEDIVARGRTNIGGALSAALSGVPDNDRPRIVIFLTDGTPTAGEQNAEKILAGVSDWNTSKSRVFVMGVGNDVNAHLLDKLAESTNGTSEYIGLEEEIDAKVASLYDRLSHPVLTDVELDFGDLATDSVYPRELPALFKGNGFMIFGRYGGGGEHSVSVRGMLNGKETEYACLANFPKKPTDDLNEFVAPLWASRNVGFLLQEIRLHGEKEELLNEVIRLSKKFGIVTEYTEFLGATRSPWPATARFGGALGAAADAGPVGAPALAVDEFRRRVSRANRFKTGQWAVQQARNDRGLQTKMVVGNAANVYLDRRGKKVDSKNIYQLGSRCFYLRNGQWCESEEAGERKTRVIKLFSDEYFSLLRKNADFAKAQKLGWAMSINVGNERIVVEKDGKQQDAALQPQQPQLAPPGNPLQFQQQQIRQVPQQQILQQFRGDLKNLPVVPPRRNVPQRKVVPPAKELQR